MLEGIKKFYYKFKDFSEIEHKTDEIWNNKLVIYDAKDDIFVCDYMDNYDLLEQVIINTSGIVFDNDTEIIQEYVFFSPSIEELKKFISILEEKSNQAKQNQCVMKVLIESKTNYSIFLLKQSENKTIVEVDGLGRFYVALTEI